MAEVKYPLTRAQAHRFRESTSAVTTAVPVTPERQIFTLPVGVDTVSDLKLFCNTVLRVGDTLEIYDQELFRRRFAHNSMRHGGGRGGLLRDIEEGLIGSAHGCWSIYIMHDPPKVCIQRIKG